MASRLIWSVYGVSFLVHGMLGIGVAGVDARPPELNRPVVITVEHVEPEEPEPPPKEKEPEPKETEPEEAKPIEPAKPEPTPKAAPKKAAPPDDGPPSDGGGSGDGDIPDFGGELGNGPGTPVPAGGGGGGDDDREPVREKKVAKARVLDKPKPAASTCEEKASKPKPLEIPEPQYTDRARAAGVEGAVRVEVTVDAKGKVARVKVLRSLDPDLDNAAKKAIEQARFEPAQQCGKPVESTFTISVKFTL